MKIEDIAPGEILVDDLWERTRKLRFLILDVDGVLTDGRLVYSDRGDETKFFFVRDGLGIRMLLRQGIDMALISGRGSPVVKRRAEELGIKIVYEKSLDKLIIFKELLDKINVLPEEIAHIGDDLLDIPILRRVGLAVTVADGVPEVKNHAHYITSKPGGFGAVRELAELILKAKGLWEAATEKYYK